MKGHHVHNLIVHSRQWILGKGENQAEVVLYLQPRSMAITSTPPFRSLLPPQQLFKNSSKISTFQSSCLTVSSRQNLISAHFVSNISGTPLTLLRPQASSANGQTQTQTQPMPMLPPFNVLITGSSKGFFFFSSFLFVLWVVNYTGGLSIFTCFRYYCLKLDYCILNLVKLYNCRILL